jgi:serine/threonine-protein kinase
VRVGRYHLYGEFATGGMATVHFGKLFGDGGFQRIVAIKVPHTPFVRDPQARAMILDEARIVAAIHSPNVVATLEVLEENGTIHQVMEYADGPSLAELLKREPAVPLPIALAIVQGMLEGLHAAHEVKDASGRNLDVVHRDVSPQNVVVAADGTPKLLDFGIASALGKLHLTQPGEVRGKVSYMAPEQVQAQPLDRRVDVYAAGVVLFQLVTGELPFTGDDFAATALLHVLGPVPDVAARRPDVPIGVREVIERALAKERRDRFATARAMAEALAATEVAPASKAQVAEWVQDVAADFFAERARALAALPAAPDPEPAAPAVAPTVEAEVTPPRTKMGRVSIAIGAVLLGGGAVGVLLFALGRDGAAPPPPTPATASAPLADAPPPSAPLADAPPPSAPLAVAVLDAAAADAAPRASNVRPSAVRSSPPVASAPPTAVACVVAPPVASAPLPPCCAGELRLRFRGCADNCPPGI